MCPKSACYSCVCHGWLTQSAVRPWPLSFLLWPDPFRGWALPDSRLRLFSPAHFFLLPPPTIPLCYSCRNDSILLGLFRPAVYSFPQWLSMVIGSPTYGLLCPFCFSLGHPRPICFLWAFLALLLTLHSHGFLLTLLGFPDPIILFSSLGFVSLPLTPYFLCLHYFGPAMAHSRFSISYDVHGYTISLFPDFFKLICLLKVHLFISWICDPLFLPLGRNGFAICLPTLCCPCCWAFFFLFGFLKNDP